MIIWPQYFDSTKKRSEGRRVPKNIAIPSPRNLEIQKILKKNGWEYHFSPDAYYPKQPWIKSGMFLIKKNAAKHQIITKIAHDLIKTRRSAKGDQSG